MTKREAKPVAYIQYHTIALPFKFENDLQKLIDESLKNQIKDTEDQVYGKSDRYYAFKSFYCRLKSFWIINVKNEGDKPCEGVSLTVPQTDLT
ncbi:hypothetical protein L0244_03410, partial [bacterium]|nr:hypothetical protein [bacterium]